MTRDALRQLTNVIGIALTVAVNAAAVALPLNGISTGELADRFPVLIQPAGWAFSIWSLIYAGLIAYAVYQALPSQRTSPILRRIGWLVPLSCLANIGWLYLWHYEFASLSIIAMLALLASLAAIYVRLGPARTRLSGPARLWVAVPFSLYLGWITVATLVNVAVVAYDQQLAVVTENREGWTIVLLAVAAAVAVTVSVRRADIAYIGVIVWAVAAIIARNDGRPLVVAAAVLTAIAAVASLGLGVLRARRQDQRLTA